MSLQAAARALAASHRLLERAPGRGAALGDFGALSRRLDRAHQRLDGRPAGAPRPHASTAWFLDNYYLIRRVARQVEEDLPDGFARRLPVLQRIATQLWRHPTPRIDAVARALVAQRRLDVDQASLQQFVAAYQEVSYLTIAELWALPTMLRATVLRYLVRALEALLPGGPSALAVEASDAELEALAPGAAVERAVRSLRVLDALDWKAFFETHSRVEQILRSDPAQVYARMDFETCDAYRKVVESLAWDTNSGEAEVASLVVRLAGEGMPGERSALVGYYLTAEGRGLLEAKLGYRPVGLERLRRAATRSPTAAFLGPLAALTFLPLALAAWALIEVLGRAHTSAILAAAALAVVPFSAISIEILQYVFARLLPPRRLAKLDFSDGLPDDARTLIVVPTLLGRDDDVGAMLRQLELHYLSNPDPRLQFAVLTDDVDARTREELVARRGLLQAVSRGVSALNNKHPSRPFHLLHREALWNEGEERFMGWERKRGKLDELNRLLRGDTTTSYVEHVGDPAALRGIRFVITLDADTELPMGSVGRLVGLLAHPLNRAVFDDRTGRVTSGYTVVQPRVDTSPTSARRTWFSRMFSGDVGFDIYTHASSELYQDLFGAGIYVGKGIYDVDAFMRSVEDAVPDNALVSHDLFEGVHGRTALATDIVLYEGYPERYTTFAARMHRWVRGDWQLLPWLLPRVPSRSGVRIANKLAAIDRWKIIDNLRRSLMRPLLLALLVSGWTWLPGSALGWTLGALGLLFGPTLLAFAIQRQVRVEPVMRAALAVAFLAFEAALIIDAIARVFVRTVFTKRGLLQWTSAAHVERMAAARSPRALSWQTMLTSPLLAVVIAALVAWLRAPALPIAAPLLALWALAPELARWSSLPTQVHAETLDQADHRKLRLLACRTWRFFDVFVGPIDQWLPLDNYQEPPHEQTAHRTSPTNIGLALLATLSAYDFGYIGPSELSLRLRRAFESIARLPHYRGHLFNWYDTKNLQALLPRYVSAVDSGNLAGCLLALKQGCKELASAPVMRGEQWDGVRDSVDLLAEVLESAPGTAIGPLQVVLAAMRELAQRARAQPATAHATLRTLCDDTSAELDRELLAFLEAGAGRHEAELLRALRTSTDRLHQQLEQMRREAETLLPWLLLRDDTEALGLELPTMLALDEIPATASQLRVELRAQLDQRRLRGEVPQALDAARQRVEDALLAASANARALLAEFEALSQRADDEARGMDFTLLYDAERKLMRIGYNATTDELDANAYDLLASEARLASYIAIVKRDLPEAHWYALGRPMTSLPSGAALLSWGGTMFEYLMPALLMRSQPGTLLDRTYQAVVDAQIAYGKSSGRPWGISESGYARVDAYHTYQYRSFGVPGLGFKRGLEDDHVVTPYASLLAVGLRPRAVVDNVAALAAAGMLGGYGLFEALDLTPERAISNRPGEPPATVVRSYMSHHQGMLLLALGNLLNRRSMVDRFHADPLIETGELLLNERAPQALPAEWPDGETGEADAAEAAPPPGPSPTWLAPRQAGPQAFVLSNDQLTSLVTDRGGGGLTWKGLALTRYQVDATCDGDGLWIYLRDEDSRQHWMATAADSRTSYAMHHAELHRREAGISMHVDIAVAPADDVEVRLITLRNETERPRRLTVTSASRPVLLEAKQAPSHPAFSSLFIESQWLGELDALVFARRPQSPEAPSAVLVHRLVREGDAVSCAGYESDRGAFYGRDGSWRAPRALTAAQRPAPTVGAVIDPLMSVTARVELGPGASATLAYVTTVARSRSAAVELARKYGSMHAVRWTFRDAEQMSSRRLLRAKLEPAQLPAVQRLLSAAMFVAPALRPSAQARAAAPATQAGLWGRGISGDDPIVLVQVHDPAAALLRELFAAQRLLRSAGVRIDVVLLDEQATGYLTEGAGTLHDLLVDEGLTEWRDRNGGVFVLAIDQLHAGELARLQAAARVMLDTRQASLAVALEPRHDRPPPLPHIEASLAATPATATEPAALELRFGNGTGGFSADGREYIIDVAPGAPTPAPWSNVLANEHFGALVTESTLGTTWSLNSGENRLTPWSNDPVLDPPSEVLYLRDEETAQIWSPTPRPAGQAVTTRVRHGAGYTMYQRDCHGLAQELTLFVPPDAPLKVIRLRLKNTTPRHRRVTATYYAEWALGPRREVQRPHIVSEFDRARGCLLATCHWNAEFAGRVAFLAAATAVHGFTADRTEFLGEGGDYARPDALLRWGLSGRADLGVDPCAALQVHLELAPGEEIETHFVLGQAASRQDALEHVARHRDAAAVEHDWRRLTAYWDDMLGSVHIKTPEPEMDVMLNRWLLYQSLACRVFGRTAFYQSSGAFGFRDQLQDVLALLHAAPGLARAHLLEAARHQFQCGDVLHWWHPPSGRGVRTRCSDDLVWLPYVAAEYVLATGDVAILEERVPFLLGEPLRDEEHDRYAHYQVSSESASLFEHCRIALERADTRGAHGLPLMGDGDWNDGMNRIGAEGRGESVWLAWFLVATMTRFAALASVKGDDAAAMRWRARAGELRAAVHAVAWDGAWYVRAFHDDGSRVGSKQSSECRIDSIAQSWAALSRDPQDPRDADRARAAVRAADAELVREAERLVLLFWPPFDTTSHDPGYVRAYPPGVRENGGQYTHAATWLGLAHAALGDGDGAARIFRLLNPILRTRSAAEVARYRVEPYVVAADIYSCAPWVGRGGWTWYTGSAAWLWRLGVEGILGLRRDGGQLLIDPCLPAAWDGCEAWVTVGAQRLHVVVDNSAHVSSGVVSVTLDGAPVEGRRVVVDPEVSGEREVAVVLG